MNPREYRNMLAEEIQAMALEIANVAPEIVGNIDMIAELRIELFFPQDRVPYYLISREHVSTGAYDAIRRACDARE